MMSRSLGFICSKSSLSFIPQCLKRSSVRCPTIASVVAISIVIVLFRRTGCGVRPKEKCVEPPQVGSRDNAIEFLIREGDGRRMKLLPLNAPIMQEDLKVVHSDNAGG